MIAQKIHASSKDRPLDHLIQPQAQADTETVSSAETAAQHQCFAILWLPDNLKSSELDTVVQDLKSLEGVGDTEVIRQSPALLKVLYCSGQTKVAQILETIRLQGTKLRWVGC